MTKIRAEYIPFFKYNTPEQLEKLAKALIGTPIQIGGPIPVEVGKVTNAYVEDHKIWWDGEIRGSGEKAK